ncbi:MAG: peptidyl-prolyl cis-trans isomerase [Deltaproteobacteria bacterium]|nr:peptidyl-prolyl cis-trans isomerase [Deltaproteobacteria bacterium]
MRSPFRRAPIAALLAAVAACAPGKRDEVPVAAGPARVAPPSLGVSAAPSWTGASPGDDAVAHVGSLPIPASRFRRALAEAGSGADPRAVLDAVIATEVLAQAAVREAGGSVTPPPAAYERAIVSALLERRFGRMTPGDVPRAEVEQLWAAPQVRQRYDHMSGYDVMDYQWICCAGNPIDCARPGVAECFAEGQTAMTRLFAEVSTRKPDPEDIPLLQPDLQPLAPRLSFQEYQFVYDAAAGVQKGRSLFDDAVVKAAVATPVGRFAPPARSKFGWHVLYVRGHTPEEHRDLSDPMVVQQIAEFFLPRWQRKAFFELLGTLVAPSRMPSLVAFFKGRELPPPRFDVALFAESLREAVAEEAAKKEEQPL